MRALTLGVLSNSVCGSPPPQAAAPHKHASASIIKPTLHFIDAALVCVAGLQVGKYFDLAGRGTNLSTEVRAGEPHTTWATRGRIHNTRS